MTCRNCGHTLQKHPNWEKCIAIRSGRGWIKICGCLHFINDDEDLLITPTELGKKVGKEIGKEMNL